MSSSMKQFPASGITARLFEIISEMGETQKKELLFLIGDQRKYKRLPYLMQISCEAGGERFMDFILDISPGGVFLETIHDLFVGQKLKMTFQFKHAQGPVDITGNVVWIGVNGAGIRFVFDSQEQKTMITNYIDQLG